MEGDCSGGEGRKAGEESAGRSAEDGRDTRNTLRSHGRCAASERQDVPSARGPGHSALAGTQGTPRAPPRRWRLEACRPGPQRTGAKPAQRGPRQAVCTCLRRGAHGSVAGVRDPRPASQGPGRSKRRLPQPAALGPQPWPPRCAQAEERGFSHTHTWHPHPKKGETGGSVSFHWTRDLRPPEAHTGHVVHEGPEGTAGCQERPLLC